MGRNEFIARLQDLYEKAENLFNDDKGNEAAELLKQEIPAIDSVAKVAGVIIPWLDATSLLANILLLLSRPTEALEYGKKVYEAAKHYLPGALELIYAEELMGTVFMLSERSMKLRSCSLRLFVELRPRYQKRKYLGMV